MKWFIQDGKLTGIAELLLGAIVLVGIFGIPILNFPIWIAIPAGVIAAIAAAVLMFEGRAAALGFKPFSSDPLGWRKAKQGYEAEASPGAAPKDEKKQDNGAT